MMNIKTPKKGRIRRELEKRAPKLVSPLRSSSSCSRASFVQQNERQVFVGFGFGGDNVVGRNWEEDADIARHED